ncbi:MAG: hypothetical protein H0W55_08785 [Actinobacteria bacterium]|nr:hypothetical protein [Actinomycetota bacterium]MDQ3532838.1 hypothetical protein [Actinomycetota bacterium]
MPIPDSVRSSLAQRLNQRRRDRWPQLTGVRLRFRGAFAYVDGVLEDGEVLRLCRLDYGGSASSWGFAIYLASKDGYEQSVLPTGSFTGSPQEALDCACGLYLGDISAWRIGRR